MVITFKTNETFILAADTGAAFVTEQVYSDLLKSAEEVEVWVSRGIKRQVELLTGKIVPHRMMKVWLVAR